MSTEAVSSMPKPGLGTGIFYALLAAVDIFVLGFPLLGLSILLLQMIYKVRSQRWHVLWALVACVVIFVGVWLNGKLAEQHAQKVIAALQAYQAEQGKAPLALADLVPKYLDSIPSLALRAFDREFAYRCDQQTCYLLWIRTPPFGAYSYNLSTQERKSLD